MINLKTGHLWITGFKKAVYWEGTVEEFCRLQRRNWLVYVAEMRKRMADKSPEELASTASWVRSHMVDIEQRLQRMGMGDDKAARSLNVVVEENPERTTIAGQSAQKYRVLVDGKVYEEVWLTTDAALAREAALQDAPETWGRYLACVQQDFGGVEETREYRQKFSLGLPLKVVSYRYFENSDAGAVTTHLAFSIDPIEVREEEFAPPADLKKVSLEELGD